jgi:hypothetical protein
MRRVDALDLARTRVRQQRQGAFRVSVSDRFGKLSDPAAPAEAMAVCEMNARPRERRVRRNLTELGQHRPRLDGRELIRIAQQNHPRHRDTGLEEPCHHREVDHRDLVDDDQVGIDRERARSSQGVQTRLPIERAMNRLGRHGQRIANRLGDVELGPSAREGVRQRRGRLARRRHQPHTRRRPARLQRSFDEDRHDSRQARRLSRARSARHDRQAPTDPNPQRRPRRLHAGALAGGQALDPLRKAFVLDRGVVGRGTSPIAHHLGERALGLVGASQKKPSLRIEAQRSRRVARRFGRAIRLEVDQGTSPQLGQPVLEPLMHEERRLHPYGTRTLNEEPLLGEAREIGAEMTLGLLPRDQRQRPQHSRRRLAEETSQSPRELQIEHGDRTLLPGPRQRVHVGAQGGRSLIPGVAHAPPPSPDVPPNASDKARTISRGGRSWKTPVPGA